MYRMNGKGMTKSAIELIVSLIWKEDSKLLSQRERHFQHDIVLNIANGIKHMFDTDMVLHNGIIENQSNINAIRLLWDVLFASDKIMCLYLCCCNSSDKRK